MRPTSVYEMPSIAEQFKLPPPVTCNLPYRGMNSMPFQMRHPPEAALPRSKWSGIIRLGVAVFLVWAIYRTQKKKENKEFYSFTKTHLYGKNREHAEHAYRAEHGKKGTRSSD